MQPIALSIGWLSGFGITEKLQRSLSLATDSGIIEDIGPRLEFEQSYWDGKFPAVDPEDEDEVNRYPLPFHPLELSEASMLQHMGFQFEGRPEDWICDPYKIPIAVFSIQSKFWWQFWR